MTRAGGVARQQPRRVFRDRTEAGRVIDLAPREYFTDVLGRLTITAERSDLLTPATLRYRIRADAYAIDLTTPLEVAILNLNTLL